MNILLAEDDTDLRSILSQYLELNGFSVLQAGNGKVGLETFHNEHVDFCILDIMMPVMDGWELARQIRKTDLEMPVIFLTARNQKEDRIKGLKLGADDYITKPFHQKELLTRIKVQLRIKDLHRELIKTERLKAIIETAISANHEINNPLCAIINHAELLESMPEIMDNPEALKNIQNILANSERIEKTLKKMAHMIQPAVTEYLPGVPMLDIGGSETGEDD